jgi:hypothetical protein
MAEASMQLQQENNIAGYLSDVERACRHCHLINLLYRLKSGNSANSNRTGQVSNLVTNRDDQFTRRTSGSLS